VLGRPHKAEAVPDVPCGPCANVDKTLSTLVFKVRGEIHGKVRQGGEVVGDTPPTVEWTQLHLLRKR
jgi:hypothetical protein